MRITLNDYDDLHTLKIAQTMVTTLIDTYDERNGIDAAPMTTDEAGNENVNATEALGLPDVETINVPVIDTVAPPPPPPGPAVEVTEQILTTYPDTDADAIVAGAPPPPTSVIVDLGKQDITIVVDVVRDKNGDGVTWDARIHSSSKKMSTRGIWNRRRNVDDALFEEVMAELQGEVITAAQTFNPPPAPDASAPPPAPASTGVEWGNVFQRTMMEVTTPTNKDKPLTMEQIHRKCVDLGVADFAALAARADLWDMFLIELSIA
jgi:hypothetical protein